MGTYDNAYAIMAEVREGLNEYSDDLVNGSDRSGAFTNDWITKQNNKIQRRLYHFILKRLPSAFLTSSDITGVDSVFALPWNYGSMDRFEDDDGYKVVNIAAAGGAGGAGSLAGPLRTHYDSRNLYYRQGNNLILTQSGVSSTYKLWYYLKPRDIHNGRAAAGGATTVTLDRMAKRIASYYDDLMIEDVTGSGADGGGTVDTITAYTTARVATVSNTWAADRYYGLVSELPEMFHHLIAPGSVILCKETSPVSFEKPSVAERRDYVDMIVEALRAFAGNDGDVPIEDVFCDFGESSNYGSPSYRMP